MADEGLISPVLANQDIGHDSTANMLIPLVSATDLPENTARLWTEPGLP